MLKRLLALVLLACAAARARAQGPVGCRPVAAEPIAAQELERLRKGLPAESARVAKLEGQPGAAWDLGEQRTARLGVYLTKQCQLGLSVGIGSQSSSSPDPSSSVQSFAEMVKMSAPDWTFSVTPPNTLTLSRKEQSYSTDLRELLRMRLDAGASARLGGSPVKLVFDGWLLFVVPEDATKALNLSVVSTVHPWALYDLTPYGLPKLLARFEDGAAVLWALP